MVWNRSLRINQISTWRIGDVGQAFVQERLNAVVGETFEVRSIVCTGLETQFLVQIDTAMRRGFVENLVNHLPVSRADGIVDLLKESVCSLERADSNDRRFSLSKKGPEIDRKFSIRNLLKSNDYHWQSATYASRSVRRRCRSPEAPLKGDTRWYRISSSS